jgi:hypothetical protein
MIGGELPIAAGGDRQSSTKADVHQGLFSADCVEKVGHGLRLQKVRVRD